MPVAWARAVTKCFDTYRISTDIYVKTKEKNIETMIKWKEDAGDGTSYRKFWDFFFGLPIKKIWCSQTRDQIRATAAAPRIKPESQGSRDTIDPIASQRELLRLFSPHLRSMEESMQETLAWQGASVGQAQIRGDASLHMLSALPLVTLWGQK